MTLETYMRHRGDNLRPPSGEMGGDMSFSPTSPPGDDCSGMTLAKYMWTGALTQDDGPARDTSQIIFKTTQKHSAKVGTSSSAVTHGRFDNVPLPSPQNTHKKRQTPSRRHRTPRTSDRRHRKSRGSPRAHKADQENGRRLISLERESKEAREKQSAADVHFER